MRVASSNPVARSDKCASQGPNRAPDSRSGHRRGHRLGTLGHDIALGRGREAAYPCGRSVLRRDPRIGGCTSRRSCGCCRDRVDLQAAALPILRVGLGDEGSRGLPSHGRGLAGFLGLDASEDSARRTPAIAAPGFSVGSRVSRVKHVPFNSESSSSSPSASARSSLQGLGMPSRRAVDLSFPRVVSVLQVSTRLRARVL